MLPTVRARTGRASGQASVSTAPETLLTASSCLQERSAPGIDHHHKYLSCTCPLTATGGKATGHSHLAGDSG